LEARTEKLKIDLLNWYKKNKRAFPWRNTTDPWQILLIETLSQQTQLERANKYFDKFLLAFPSPKSMANSSLKIILNMWSGLGYNNRAKRLYEASKIIEKKGFNQIYPNFDDLPGVGPYTKNAILSFAYGEKVLAIDTNIERIIQRYFGLNDSKDFFKENSKYFLHKVSSRDINQAFMDFGSSICKSSNPTCNNCPIESGCSKYFSTSKKSKEKFKGSNREVRGKIVKLLINKGNINNQKLFEEIDEDSEKIKKALEGLKKDNLIMFKKNNIIEINSN
jgi:A/G-specific adenine glycosylase